MSLPVHLHDATPGTEVTLENRLSPNGTYSSSPSSTSPPSAQQPTADSEPVSSTATPMAQPDPSEVPAPRVVSDLPTRPVSVPPGPVTNGHAAAVASSASPSLPTQPRPTTAPVTRPLPAGQGQPLPPAFDEKLPLFGVLKTRTIQPPAPQPPIPRGGLHPTLMVQPQQPQSHQQPHPHQQAHSHQPQSHPQLHQHPHPHPHPHPHAHAHPPQQTLPPPPPPVVPSSASPPVANAVPGGKHMTNTAAFNDEYSQLSALLRRSSPGVVRRVVRDNWERCLLGTEFHTTFVTNVAVHHASGGILQRALGDFGARIVEEGTTQIANLLTQKHLDDVFTILLPKMSDRFLDAAVSHRLPSIPAQRLLNHLARAERLGYDANDIEEEADEPEPLIPATMTAPRPSANPPPPPAHPHAQTPSYTQPTQQSPHQPALQPPKAAPAPPPRPLQHQAGQNGQAPTDGADTPFTCSSCHKTFIHEAAFRYHHRKAVCKRDLLGPLLSQCPFCYKGFASDGGLSYHLLNNVCGVSGGTPNDLARIKRSVVDASKASSSASSPALMTPQSASQPPRQTPVPVPGSRGIPGPAAAISSSPAGPPPVQSDIFPSFHQHYAPAPSTPTPPTPNDQALRAGAHLEPAQRMAMEAEMRRAEDNLKSKIDEAKRSWDPADLERRLSSLRNSHATKQSQIRKKYGIRLRTRRGPSAMIEERLRVGLPADLPAKKHSTPGMPDGTTPPPNGSQALNTNGKRPLYSDGSVQPSPSHPPVKKLAVSELTGGLGGTSATAAMQDPTAVMNSQDNSGYYTSTSMNPSQSHFADHPSSAPGSSGQQRVQATPQRIQMGVAGRGISREEPVDVDSSSDSGSDIEAD